MAPKLSVVIPHSNTTDSVTRLLRSLEPQQCSFPYEVIVVCNPPGKYATYPHLPTTFPLLWLSSERGANAARQVGVEAAQAPLVLFLDDDCHIDNIYFLQNHHDMHVLHSDAVGIGGEYALTPKNSLWGRTYHHLQKKWLLSHRLPQNYYAHLLGGNSSFKKSIFEKEKFNTNLIFGGTETEFQIRLVRQGERFRLIEDMTVVHDGRVGFLEFLRKGFQQGIGREYITDLHGKENRFIFSPPPFKLSPAQRFAVSLYNSSFEAGRRFYRKKKLYRAPRRQIYIGFAWQFIKDLHPRRLYMGRELVRLYDSSMIEILASKRKNDGD
jgi:glycosyltransferase involved in cell wall biosynthesis